MRVSEDLCHKCAFYDICEDECKAGHTLYERDISEYRVVTECEDYGEKQKGDAE